jgi:arsenate reductase
MVFMGAPANRASTDAPSLDRRASRQHDAGLVARFEIFHNPRCGKSRQTLARLTAAGITPVIVEYLVEPPSTQRLQALLQLLGFDDPRQLMRTKEPVYAALGLARVSDPQQLLAAMVANPILIERPIVIKDGKRAVLGRPPENVDALL